MYDLHRRWNNTSYFFSIKHIPKTSFVSALLVLPIYGCPDRLLKSSDHPSSLCFSSTVLFSKDRFRLRSARKFLLCLHFDMFSSNLPYHYVSSYAMDVIPWATWKLYVYRLLKEFLPEEFLMLYKLFFKYLP